MADGVTAGSVFDLVARERFGLVTASDLRRYLVRSG
jgi:hypothetical protein